MKDPKATDLFREVAAKTAMHRIQWEPSATDDLVAAIGGEFTLRLFPYRGEDPDEPDYALVLDDAQGRQLIRVDSEEEGVPLHRPRDLYEAARYQALRVDEKLDRVLGELAKL